METKAIQAYEKNGIQLLESAKGITITDQSTREYAVEFTAGARRVIKTIEAEFRPDVEKAHSLHKDLLARLNTLTAPFKEARGIVDGEISRDYLEQERIQREEKRAAQIKADVERKRQEDALDKEVEETIRKGDMETAEALLDSEVVSVPVMPVAEVKRTVNVASGSATVKKDIKVELVNARAVLIAIITNKLPVNLITVDLGAAKRYAKAGDLKTMPGFRITETAIVSGRVS